ncbi:MAG: class I SAM-dependent methyltransferase [Desulfocapsa sp.]|nr:class I SAM-dependent methyltransferase [Desulfocapsa sp.]
MLLSGTQAERLTVEEERDNMHPKITYEDIDWHRLWQNARELKSWTPKGPADWDKKAPSFAKRNSDSPFIDLVLHHLPLTPETTVLDAGSGPGTLSLPLAGRVKSVTALDYSRGMLDVLEEQARQQGSVNIRTVHGSWEDDWEKLTIEQHDICIASRSLSVADLRSALAKLDFYARSHVFIVDRISPTPFDRGAFEAVGRPFRSGPDYIYTINTLYSMGIHASVDVISLNRESSFTDMQAAMDSYCWMFKDLTPYEEKSLQGYIHANSRPAEDGSLIVTRANPLRWAIISWKKNS